MLILRNNQLSLFPIILSSAFAIGLISFSFFFFPNKQSAQTQTLSVSPSPTSTPTPTPYIPREDPEYTKDWVTYTNDELGFSFKYPKDTHELLDDSERKILERSYNSKGRLRSELFSKEYSYSSPKELVATTIIERKEREDGTGFYHAEPFSVWVFPNEETLDIYQWYGRYGYFPFTLGPSYNLDQEKPLRVATINNVDAGYFRQLGRISASKLMYVGYSGYTYLIKAIEYTSDYTLENAKIADQILATFKFSK